MLPSLDTKSVSHSGLMPVGLLLMGLFYNIRFFIYTLKNQEIIFKMWIANKVCISATVKSLEIFIYILS